MTSVAESSVKKVYEITIADVMKNIKKLFVEEGIGHDVLKELQDTWQNKLSAALANEAGNKENVAVTLANATATTPVLQEAPSQLDGNDSSEENSYSDDASMMYKCEEQEYDDTSLNSNDDITDEDPDIAFQTNNIIVCQYKNVKRRFNRWKFMFTSGVMHLNGKDYVFKNANGTAEW